jgi:phospholipase/carboxylesterase
MNFPLQSIWHPSPSATHLMIVMHGRGDDAAGYNWLPPALKIPFMSYLLLQAPDPYYDGFSWYDLPPDHLPGIVRSRELLTQTLDEVIRQGYRPEQIFLFGFSQGCMMTLEFGARYHHALKGYIGISGYCYDPVAMIREANPQAMKSNWIVTHGHRDDVLNIERTRAQMKQLQDGGFQLEYLEFKKKHTIDEKIELPFLREWILERGGLV